VDEEARPPESGKLFCRGFRGPEEETRRRETRMVIPLDEAVNTTRYRADTFLVLHFRSIEAARMASVAKGDRPSASAASEQDKPAG